MGTGKQTYDDQRSKQVRAVSMTSKDVLDKLYSTPYCEVTNEDRILKSKGSGTYGEEIIEITKSVADAGFEEICVRGSGIRNRTRRTRAVDLRGRCNVVTFFLVPELRRNHRTCCCHSNSPRGHYDVDNTRLSQDILVRDRTGEIRPLTTKTYIIKSLKYDLLSRNALDKAGYRIVLDGIRSVCC
jgi:hypothetical protein